MKCEQFLDLMSLYLDNELDKQTKSEFEQHLSQCKDCENELKNLEKIISSLNDIPLEELPDGFHEKVMDKVIAEKTKPSSKFNYKHYIGFAAAFAVVAGISLTAVTINPLLSTKGTATEASSDEMYQNSFNESAAGTTEETASVTITQDTVSNDMATTAEAQMENGSSQPIVSSRQIVDNVEESNVLDERKLIKTFDVSIEVKNYDETITEIKDFVSSVNGYIENYSSDTYYNNGNKYNNGNFTIRIPKESYEGTKSLLKELGEISYENENTQDVTSQYIDTQSRLEAKKVEEDRLLELLSQAESVDDIIKIEERLGNIRAEIESYESSLKNWDKLVSYSTIYVYVQEVDSQISSVSVNFIDKIKSSLTYSINEFIYGCQNLVLAVASNWLQIVIAAVVIIVVAAFAVNRYKKYKKRKNDMM